FLRGVGGNVHRCSSYGRRRGGFRVQERQGWRGRWAESQRRTAAGSAEAREAVWGSGDQTRRIGHPGGGRQPGLSAQERSLTPGPRFPRGRALVSTVTADHCVILACAVSSGSRLSQSLAAGVLQAQLCVLRPAVRRAGGRPVWLLPQGRG
ncbi:unnamed protein product, partial [Rangifer tarandus platyrhynchus]